MAKRRSSKEMVKAKKKAAKAMAMSAPGGKSRYCERPVDPNRSVVNPVAVKRHLAMLAEAGLKPDEIHRHMTGQQVFAAPRRESSANTDLPRAA